jgi:NAD(P)-dependent dehydrogenase (short-subunit alcohol dehydrogenase family)
MRLQGKVAVVTGAGRGIGRAIAERLAREGATVVVNDIDERLGEETVDLLTARGGQAFFVRADVASRTDVQRLAAAAMDRFGALNILINNAICSRDSIERHDWDSLTRVGLVGPWLTMTLSAPLMERSGGGSIVNISDVQALGGFGREHFYGAVKAGLVAMTRSLAVSLGPRGIRVNCICPGAVVTPAWKPATERDPQLFERLRKVYPLGRLGKPEDVATAAVFLASDESSFITGAVLVVDGGLTAGNLALSSSDS